MNKKLVVLILGVIILGVAGVVLANFFAEPDAGGTEIRATEQVITNPRQTPQARPNTFGIMTPEEKAAAEAARAAAEAARASSTASSTATSTDETSEDESES